MRITGTAVMAFGAVLLLAGFIAGYSVGRNQIFNENGARRAAGTDRHPSDGKVDEGILPAVRADETLLEREVRERTAAQALKDLKEGDALQKAYLKKLKRDYDRLDDTGGKGL